MTTLCAAIEALLADPQDVILARSILGTDDAAAIADRVSMFMQAQLGRTVVGCPLFIQSVGAVFGLDLDDGSRVVLKAHALDASRFRGSGSLADLDAVYGAQAEMRAQSFPCAEVLLRPRPFGDGAAAVMSYLAAKQTSDPTAPDARHALARELARFVELAASLKNPERLPRRTLPAALLPAPHNALFDFDRPGGEWIDDRARAARAVLDAEDRLDVVMHCDFSCGNVFVEDARVTAVFDMDSVGWIDELRCVASAAVHFPYPARWATRDEARAFVDDYLAARGRSLTLAERRKLDAAAIYAMAYTARCEHQPGATSTMGELLSAAPDAYF